MVDDEEPVRIAMERTLRIAGYTGVRSFADWPSAVSALQERLADLVLLDIVMPKVSGVQALEDLRRRWPPVKAIMVTGINEVDIAVRCMKCGASDYLTKPVDRDALLGAVGEVLEGDTPDGEAAEQGAGKEHQILTPTQLAAYHPDLLAAPVLTGPDAQVLQPIVESLVRLLREGRGYVDPTLSSVRLAAVLETNTTYLSRAVNAAFGTGIRDLLNRVRIAAVFAELGTERMNDITIDGLATEAGYANRSTFYRAFRSILGGAPGEFIDTWPRKLS